MSNNYREQTLNYYNTEASAYFDLTSKVSMNQNLSKFLQYINPGDLILDFGCGSGRDSRFFKNNGFNVEAIDGSQELCKLASGLIEQEVMCMDFMEFNEKDKYDAIWACASLLHLNREDLITVLNKLRDSLKKDGYMYTCFKVGTGEEFDKNGRYYMYMTEQEILALLSQIDRLDLLEEYITASVIKANEKPWLNLILQKK